MKDNLVEFSVDFLWAKLFKEAPELQRVDGHNLCASSLPPVSETNWFCTISDTISCSYIHIGNRELYKIQLKKNLTESMLCDRFFQTLKYMNFT